MTRKLATLAEIAAIYPHPNADALELALVRGWQIVVKKGEFEPGDRCVYVEIDSVLPDRPEFEFLRPRNFRIKTIRLRGELSQGIVFPESIIPDDAGPFNEGDDLTEVLGIRLYQPPIPACLAGDVEGKFPNFIPKTDCERIQNYAWLLEDPNRVWAATEKLDGSSVTYFWKDGHFGVCSRNWELREAPNNAYWIAAHYLDIPAKLANLNRNIALQGELLGPKVQGNPYQIGNYTVYFFDVYDIDQGRYLDFPEKRWFLHENGLEMVPLIFEAGRFNGETVNDVLQSAEGFSQIGDCEREGLVFLPLYEERNPEIGRVAFKAISNRFLLKHE